MIHIRAKPGAMAGTVILGTAAARVPELAARLRSWGYEPLACETPARLVATVQQHPGEPVLLAPAEGFDAYEAAARIRTAGTAWPAILLVGAADLERALETDVHVLADAAGLKPALAALSRNQRGRSAQLVELRALHEEGRWATERTQAEMVRRLAQVAEYRDHQESPDHITRVGQLCGLLAEGLGLDRDEAERLALASALHDVGKVAIPDAVLLKPGPLDSEERALMQQHTILGARLLTGSSSETLQLAERLALTHHERWDGAGYPYALAGADIPIEGRICALADALEALTSERPYRAACSQARAREIIGEGRGTHFDPQLVDLLEAGWERASAILLSKAPRR